MKINQITWLALICTTLVLSTASVASAEKKEIEPRALEVLKDMSEYLQGAKQFTFEAETFYDQVLEGGQKIRYNAAVNVSIKRPKGFQVDLSGDLKERSIYYDGKQLSLHDPILNFYVTKETKSSIDGALKHIAKEFDVVPPLSEFLLSDPYKALIDDVQSGMYVGYHQIHGKFVHHLAFTQEDVDWEIWIEDGKMLVPRMLVITYKKIESSPQYTAMITDWDFNVRLPDSLFSFAAPVDAIKIDFLTAQSQEE